MEIRAAKSDEAQALEDFVTRPENAGEGYRTLAIEDIASAFRDETRPYTFMIALDDGKIIGCAGFAKESFAPGLWGISWMNVSSERRSKGIGGQLLESCIAEISKRNNGPFTAILATLPGKSKLYERHGFQKVGLDHEGGGLMTRIITK